MARALVGNDCAADVTPVGPAGEEDFWLQVS
jgi:hypothetical protein